MKHEPGDGLHASAHRIRLVKGEKRLPVRECAKLQVLLAAAESYPAPVEPPEQANARAVAIEHLLAWEWLIKVDPPEPAKESTVEEWAKDVFFMRDNGANGVVDDWIFEARRLLATSGVERRREK